MKKQIKSPEAIEKMRIAGRMAADTLVMITPYVREGITTEELNDICHDYIVNELQAIPACLGYMGIIPFPKSVCTSVNHVVCHGIPGPKKLKDGDILNIDVTVIKDQYHGDTSKMFIVGKPSIQAARLVQTAQDCLYLGISMVKPGESLKKIGAAMQKLVESKRFSTVREYCGHGIGTEFHEQDFHVLHYDAPDIIDIRLEPGMTFTIEPMVNAGKRHVKLLPDHWTVVTKDHALSAQWEHTILVTDTGCEVLTRRPEESF
jgi:methionyl aminopeptidase